MKLARIGNRGEELPVLVAEEGAFDLRPVVADIDKNSLTPDSLKQVHAAFTAGALERIEVRGKRVGSPIARPGAIVAIGMNYAAHAAESGALVPAQPVVFLKPTNTIGGPNDMVHIPRRSVHTDWEVELGIVIGSHTHYLDHPVDACHRIAGFVLANDISEREWQFAPGGQWTKGKGSPGFTPLGPWLVTPDELNPGDLRLRSWVNGELRQDSSTTDLVFGVAEIVHHVSQFIALEPGDLILTGTPEGVALSGRFPYLVAGDFVELEAEGLGRQRQEYGRA